MSDIFDNVGEKRVRVPQGDLESIQGGMIMSRDKVVSSLVKEFVAKYPESAPTEQDRKEWREEGKERRKHEGVHPRKAALVMKFRVEKIQRDSIWVTAGKYDPEQYTSDDLENAARDILDRKVKELDQNLRPLGMASPDYQVYIPRRVHPSDFWKVSATISLIEQSVDRIRVEREINTIFS